MDSKMLEVFDYVGLGYKPVHAYGDWRVAYLRYCDDYAPRNVTRLERHMETDEVFVLLNGHAILFLGAGEKALERVHAQVMTPGKIYNVRRKVWHAIIVSKDANILVVENNDTGEANTEFIAMNDFQRQWVVEAARQENSRLW